LIYDVYLLGKPGIWYWPRLLHQKYWGELQTGYYQNQNRLFPINISKITCLSGKIPELLPRLYVGL